MHRLRKTLRPGKILLPFTDFQALAVRDFSLRVTESFVIGTMDKSGLPAETMARYMVERETHWEMLAMAPSTLALPPVTILIGSGIMSLKSNPVKGYVGPVLILGEIAFLLAQGTETDWGLHYFGSMLIGVGVS